MPVTTRPAAGRTTSPVAAQPSTAAGGPPATSMPPGGVQDPGGPPPAAGTSPVTATFYQDGYAGPNGIIHFSGTVEVDNSGRRPAGGWRVTMRIPGGNPVYGDGSVEVSQNGAQVAFTPYEPVPPGGSMSFTFTVGGVLPAAPSGCAINGHPCS
jgi:hypothetical protein